jgi:OFA family oxalate/formate antiporter-like MFS transporter
MSLLPLVIAVLTNFSFGSFYAWSVMVAPLETALGVGRSDISLAYSVAFITMTVGMFVTHSLLKMGSLAYLLFVFFTVAGLGMAIAGYFEALWSLIVGYGVLFGFAIGVTYFLAMTAASLKMPIRPSIALSLNMSAFAGGGLVWPPIFAAVIEQHGPHAVLLMFAILLIVVGALCGLLMHAARPPAHSAAEEEGGLFTDILTDRPRIFILFWLGFLFIGFAALMSIGHAAGIAVDFGLAPERAYWAPMLTNLVYIGGALIAGVICDWITGRRVLIAITVITAAPLLVLYFMPSSALSLIALAIVGGAFGASASAFPVTIAGYYGFSALPRVYGRIGSAYGLSGLLGPLAAGVLYDWQEGYDIAILIAGIIAVAGIATMWMLPRMPAQKVGG